MIYIYETVPAARGEEIRRFELKQSIHDAALTRHPDTGETIRRVIVGGAGIITGKSAGSGAGAAKPTHGGCCGGGCGGHH